MSGYYYSPIISSEEQNFNFNDPRPMPQSTQPQSLSTFAPQPFNSFLEHQELYNETSEFYQSLQPYQPYQYQLPPQQQSWIPPPMPSGAAYAPANPKPFPQYAEPFDLQQDFLPVAPSRTSTGYLSPEEAWKARKSCAISVAESNASSLRSASEVSRSVSPSVSEMTKWGSKNDDGCWSCAYPGCSSKCTFSRGCDLRKHYKRHMKSLFCRHDGCPQATEGGFSSKKDRARHEAKHNPNIVCEWEGCERLFSRQDNMKDHVRRVHKRRLNH